MVVVEWLCVGGNDCEGPEVSPFLKVWVTTIILPGTQTGFAHLFLSSNATATLIPEMYSNSPYIT